MFKAETDTYDTVISALEKELDIKKRELTSWSASTTEENLEIHNNTK